MRQTEHHAFERGVFVVCEKAMESRAFAKDANPKRSQRKSNVLCVPDTKITKAAFSSFGFKLASSERNRLGSPNRIPYNGGKCKMQGAVGDVFGKNGNLTPPMIQVK